MIQETVNSTLDEALNAFEASDFAQAESLSRHVLQRGYNKAHCCTDFTKALRLAAKSHAKLEENEEICGLVETVPRHGACILSHAFPEDMDPFHGTAEGFTAMCRHQQHQSKSLPRSVLAETLSTFLFLCNLCLDYGLYSCALNLALQLHSTAWESEQHPPEANSSSSTIYFEDSSTQSDHTCELSINGNHQSLDLPPTGLTRKLWLRVVECCRGLTPVVAFQQSKRSSLQKSNDHEYISAEVLTTVNGSNGLSVDPSEEPHFSRVHEFSVKEEQLRVQTQANHEARRNSRDHTPCLEPSFDQPDNGESNVNLVESQENGETDREPNLFDFYSLDAAVFRRAREDYLSEPGAIPAGSWGPCSRRSKFRESNSNALTTDSVVSVPLGPGALAENQGSGEAKNGTVDAICARPKMATPSNMSVRDTGETRRYWLGDSEGDGDDEGDENADDENDSDDVDREKYDKQEMDKSHSPSSPQPQPNRRVSILRSPSTNTDAEVVKSPQKHVRFSLDSTHPSPALEAEYGGRSNRRRLIDFARRRQLLSHLTTADSGRHVHPIDGSDSLYYFLFQANYSIVSGLAWCWRKFSQLCHCLFCVQLGLLVSLSLLVWFVTGLMLLFCSSTLHLPLGQLWLPLNDSESHRFERTDTLAASERVCVWLFRWLTDYLPRMVTIT